MKKLVILAALACAAAPSFGANDWDGIAIPATAPSGKTWVLQGTSDNFNYSGQPSAFTNRWKPSFVNSWTGPSITVWHPDHVWGNGSYMAVQAHRMPGTNKIYAGCMTSKASYTYPIYLEAKVKLANNVMASDVWMISADQTQEIDDLEAYGSDRSGQEWYAQRIHLSHHVFVRSPFADYQPTDAGSWYYNGTTWRNAFHRYGVYWKDAWTLQYYIDGKLVRTVSGKSMIDPKNYTGGTGLNKAMYVILNMEQQQWRTDGGIVPTDADLLDQNNRNIMWVDWVRVYKAVAKSADDQLESNTQLTASIYPNPVADGQLNIAGLSSEVDYQMEVINLNGQLVYSTLLQETEFYQMNLTGVASSGVYVLKLSSTQGIETHKLIIQ